MNVPAETLTFAFFLGFFFCVLLDNIVIHILDIIQRYFFKSKSKSKEN